MDDDLQTIRRKWQFVRLMVEWAPVPEGLRFRVAGELDDARLALTNSDPKLAQALASAADVLDPIARDPRVDLYSEIMTDFEMLLERLESNP